jgi:hypothetical protein
MPEKSAIIVLAAVLLAAVVSPAAARQEGRWCATVYFGQGESESDCSYRTFEACVPYVIAGNKGFCTQNPRWQGDPPVVPRKPNRKRD